MLNKKTLDDFKQLSYKIIIETINDEFGTEFMAYTRELGKYSFYGKGRTIQEAVSDFQIIKDEFIEYLFDNNKPIPEPITQSDEPLPNGVITLRTTPVMHAQLIQQAKDNNVSLNQYLNQMISGASAVNDVKNHFDRQIQYVCDRMSANFDAFYGWMHGGIQLEQDKYDSVVRKYKTPEGEKFWPGRRK